MKDIPETPVAGIRIGSYKKGDRAELPNWIIEQLIKLKYAEVAPEAAYESLRRLQNLSREEEKKPHVLQTFHPFLYTAMNRKILRLQSDMTSTDPREYEAVEDLLKIPPSLIETRLSKILRVAKSNAYTEKKQQMALHERWLCEELIELFSSWRQNMSE
ncbi:MAG: hypothetical protein JW779_09950 [Candidatus Thorarchaeota archaeon]|nr:hypothetical protein [Candidatus Thorarchaeota archaeon]